MRLASFPLFLTLICAFDVVAADFASGVSAYDKGDFVTARKEWEPLAEGGSAAAQFNLGLMFYNGVGAVQDYAAALRWFERAANQGYNKAQRNLGAMYGVGKGVKRDYVQAYKWFNLCAAGGTDSCVSQRDQVARKLSSTKLVEAQRITREWKVKPEQQKPQQQN